MAGASHDEGTLRATFDAPIPMTVGLEEEVLLVDGTTMLPVPSAAEVVRAAGDPHIKVELPACQVEGVTPPRQSVQEAVADLSAARVAMVDAAGEDVRPIAAAVHPLVHSSSFVTESDRGHAIEAAYGEVARRQVVGALQVHVAVGSAAATIPVYNALRGHLPELAALAAAAPFHEGRDSGFASVRPLIAAQLPRQGVPPIIDSWAGFADELRWGATSGWLPEPKRWWWELRPHVLFGTLEVRVPDVQPTIAAAGAVAAVVHALVSLLTARVLDGEVLPAPPTWRIAENRWSALRDGVQGDLADLDTGERSPTEVRLHDLLDQIEAHAPAGLDHARRLIEHNTADELRAVGLQGAVPWLIDAFTEE